MTLEAPEEGGVKVAVFDIGTDSGPSYDVFPALATPDVSHNITSRPS
jgi:hypothetical protein